MTRTEQIRVTPRRVGSRQLSVGESPFWDAENQCLWVVDIIGRALLRIDPSSDRETRWDIEDFPTAVTLTEAGRVALVCASGVVWFDPESGRTEPFCAPEAGLAGNRLNEANADPEGRLWVGSMQTNLNPDGSLREMTQSSGAVYCLAADGTSRQMTDASFGITNTMAWDCDRRRFYVGDTLADTLFSYEYDPVEGSLGTRRIHAHKAGPGAPDGSCLDADGCLWNARYGGGCLLRIDPTGDVIQRVDLPATNITDCTFGGAGNRTLFVTSATNGLSPEIVAANPFEGAVMAFEPGVVGRSDDRMKSG